MSRVGAVVFLLLTVQSAVAAAQALPSPWTSQDVGPTGAPGSASVSSGTFTVHGAGADIWGASDAFQFVSQPVSGDVQIVARVVSVQNTHTYAKAGIMLRETLSAASQHVMLDVRPGGGIEFMTRPASAAQTQFLNGATQPAPAWLKLTRTGTTVAAFVSPDGSTWQALGTTKLTAGGALSVGLVVTSHVAGTINTSTFDNVAVTGGGSGPCTTGTLPSPWTDQDIGPTGLAGCTSYSNGVFTVAGAGSDIWGTADSFHFMSQSIGGDGQIVARVASLQNTNTYAKAGIMWRETLAAGSSHVILDVRPNGSIEFMSRSSAGGSTTFIAGTTRTFPVWLKLTRSGSAIAGWVSADGATWAPVGTAAITMTAAANVGVAVTSHTTSALSTSTLDNVSVTGATPPPDTATVVGALRSYSTIYSIGVEWDITGDTNHNAAASSEYRVEGQTAWKPALPLIRVDYNGANMLAGSTMFLEPNTTYEVRLTLVDPDGGGGTRIVSVATRAIPSRSLAGRTFHAVPGAGGGDGSSANPFKGVAAAQAAVAAGDTVLLHAGSYGGRVQFNRGGSTTSYVAWKAAGDGEALLSGIDVAASHLWLEGLTVRDQTYGILSVSSPTDVVIERCRFFNNHNSIFLGGAGTNWYIADNTIVGDTPYSTESLDGEGIELHGTSGHTVAHNSITNVADGVSSPVTNVDIFGNDIFDTSDDGVEADGGLANVRIWGNRIHNAVHNAISFQPQNGAPWYIVRNQIVNNKEAAFKFRTTDRFVLLHNTIVNWGNAYPGDAMMCCNEDHVMRGISRNNLWVSIQGGQIWGFDAFTKDWRADLDVDGFDWGSATNPFTYGGVVYPDLASFSAASGLETHGIRVSHASCFETFNVPNPPGNPVPPQVLTLKAGCNAIDAGAALPNVDDGAVTGAAPDLGAFEYGEPPPAFGPRMAAGDIVVYAADVPASARHGAWTPQASALSPNGIALVTTDTGAANTTAPLAAPVDYFDVSFEADAATPYRIWLRVEALNNSKYNDSLWVQFSDARANGAAIYQLNSTSGLLVNLATDGTANSLNGWGGQNAAYWLSQPTTVTFANSGTHTLRIQIREDGVQLDQIVLSRATYLASAPGGTTNDTTIVPKP